MSTDMVLIDEKGSYIHATIKSNIVHRFRGVFAEGGIYFIKNFSVIHNRSKYRVVGDNKLMMQLYANTTVTNVDNEDENFIRHRFDFLDFDKFEGRKGQDYILTDVIGRVVCEGKIQKTKVYGKDVNFLALELEDIWGKKVRITLWDRSPDDYQKQRALFVNTSIIGVFTSNLVKDYKGSTTLSSTSATKIYLNLDQDEVTDFKEKYRTSGGEDGIKPLESQGQGITRELILSKKKTIAEILDIVATDFEDGIDLFCQATISNICNNNGWYYNSCSKCKRIIKPSEDKFWCNHCQKLLDDAIPRYRLELQVSDESGTTKFILFDEEAEKMIGQSATSLFDIETNTEDGDYEGEVPFLIKNLITSSYVFRVKLTTYNKTAYKQSFTANKVFEETILQECEGDKSTILNHSNEATQVTISDADSDLKAKSNTERPNSDGSTSCTKRRRLRIVHSDDDGDSMDCLNNKVDLEDSE